MADAAALVSAVADDRQALGVVGSAGYAPGVHARRTPALDAPPLVRYGLPELVHGAQPAAGADFVLAITGSFFARLVSLFCRLTTDANVAAREVVVEYRDGAGLRYALFGAPVTVAASDAVDFSFSAYHGQAEWAVDGSVLVPLGPQLLLPTHDLRVHVVNAQAGDQLSDVRLVWERFYTASQPPILAPEG